MNNQTKNLIIGTVVSTALLFGTVWVIGKAWKASQK